MKILVTGGCKNGKSFYAQQLIHKQTGDKFYIATMQPKDHEDEQRIKRHKQEREGYGFKTIEQPRDIIKCIKYINKNSSVLLDSTTALLSNEMFYKDGHINYNAHIKIIDELILLCNAVKNIAIVSDWIYSDAEQYDDLTEKYRFALAYIDKVLAKKLDIVCEISFSYQIFHKGCVNT